MKIKKQIKIGNAMLVVLAIIGCLYMMHKVVDNVRYVRQQAHCLPNDTTCAIMRIGVAK
jgi:hypothetical protein